MASGGGVKIVARVRPMLARELAFDNGVEVLSDTEIVVYKPEQEFASICDRVLGVQSTQDDVYQQVKGGILSALAGYNSTVIAYGQTGTGKTHTMMGEHGTDVLEADAAKQRQCFGIIPRAVQDVFAHAKAIQVEEVGCEVQARENYLVTVVASYMEIYNDRLYDLLQPYKQGGGSTGAGNVGGTPGQRDPLDVNRRKEVLEVREDPAGNTYVQDLMCVKVKSQRNVLQLIARGNRNRAVRHTEMNIHSSRSHAILQLALEQWPDAGRSGRVIRSKLNFVDLAGSERWNTRLDMQAERISELTSINSSLSALASVVAALSEGRAHVPYRSSKLTHLLQDSLGGNCHTTIISTVSPSADAFDETVSTLKFADRAANLGNNPIVNVSRDMSSVLALKEKEIQRLRQLLAQLTSAAPGGGGAADPALVAEAVAEFGGGDDRAAMQEELQAMRRALDSERALRADLEARLQHVAAGGALPPPGVAAPASAPPLGAGGCEDPSTPTAVAGGRLNYLQVGTPPASAGRLLGGDELSPSEDGLLARRALAWGDAESPHDRRRRRQQQQRRSAANRRSAAAASPVRRSQQQQSPESSKASKIEEAIRAIRERIEELSAMEGKAAARRRDASNAKQREPLAQRQQGRPERRNQVQSAYSSGAPSPMPGDAPSPALSPDAGLVQLGRVQSGRRYLQEHQQQQRMPPPQQPQQQQQLGSGWGLPSPQEQLGSGWGLPSPQQQQHSSDANAAPRQQQAGEEQLGAGGGGAQPAPAAPPARWGRSALLSKFTDEPLQMPSPASPDAAGVATTVRSSCDGPLFVRMPPGPSTPSSSQPHPSPSAASVSSVASPMGSGGGWGRSGLLAAGGGGGAGGGWGRSALAAHPPVAEESITELSNGGEEPYLQQQLPPRPFGRSALGLGPTPTGGAGVLQRNSFPKAESGPVALLGAAGQGLQAGPWAGRPRRRASAATASVRAARVARAGREAGQQLRHPSGTTAHRAWIRGPGFTSWAPRRPA